MRRAVCRGRWSTKGRGAVAALRAKGMGAHVIVTDVEPLPALDARMDEFQAMPLAQVAPPGDFLITLTANHHPIRAQHFFTMTDGAIARNSGHFNVELDLEGLARIASSRRHVREMVEAMPQKGAAFSARRSGPETGSDRELGWLRRIISLGDFGDPVCGPGQGGEF